MKKKLVLLMVVIAMFGAMLAACTPTPTDSVTVTLDKATLELLVGETSKLNVEIVGGGHRYLVNL